MSYELPFNCSFVGRSLYLKEYNLLINGDWHFGRTNPKINIPEFEYNSIKRRILSDLDESSADCLVINGDFLNHIPDRKIDEKVYDVINEINKSVEDIIFTVGNHEEKFGGYPERIRNNYKVTNEYSISNFLIHHGHHTPTKQADYHIINHLHPIHNGKSVVMHHNKAYYDSSVTVLPAYSNYVAGSEVKNMKNPSFCPILSDGIEGNNYRIINIMD